MTTYAFYEWPLTMDFLCDIMGTGWASVVSRDGQFIGLAPGTSPDWRGTYRNEWIERSLSLAIQSGDARLLKLTVFDNEGL